MRVPFQQETLTAIPCTPLNNLKCAQDLREVKWVRILTHLIIQVLDSKKLPVVVWATTQVLVMIKNTFLVGDSQTMKIIMVYQTPSYSHNRSKIILKSRTLNIRDNRVELAPFKYHPNKRRSCYKMRHLAKYHHFNLLFNLQYSFIMVPERLTSTVKIA